MDLVHDDRYVVFVRTPDHPGERPDGTERALITCASYAEARRVRREIHNSSRECTIRYIGPAGGGD
jgi:hypothetical protein